MPEKWYGWGGTILRVDLTRKKIAKVQLTKEMARKWLGGRGFNMKVLWDDIEPGIDPLGPENVLCFGVGPLTGTLLPSSSRCSVSAKAPLTGILGDGNFGGHWPAEVKHAGYDQIIILGKAKKPLYLSIVNDDSELKDASYLWSKTVSETTNEIKKDLGDPETKVVVCGPAGEHLVRVAVVMSDLFRAGGRPGMGAVMGSKNLKAIAIRGTKGVEIALPKEIGKLANDFTKEIMEHPDYLSIPWLGTPSLYPVLVSSQTRAKNFQTLILPDIENLYGDVLLEKYTVNLKACWACPIHCSRFHEVLTPIRTGVRGAGPEWNAICHLGCMTGTTDLAAVIKYNNLCNSYGMDVCSTGDAIAWAMECYQRGIITKYDTDGLKLEWGDPEVVIELINKMAKRKGFGNILAEGSYNAARIIGRGSMQYDCTVKGMSHADLRENYWIALQEICSTRGGDHLRGGCRVTVVAEYLKDPKIADLTTTFGKGRGLTLGEHLYALDDCLTTCKIGKSNSWWFGLFNLETMAKFIYTATGWKPATEELLKIGERVYLIEMAFNTREGITRKQYRLPWRFANEPVPAGPTKGQIVRHAEVDIMLEEYFRYRGCNVDTGIPTRARLEEVGLKYVADELEAGGPYPEWVGPKLHKSYP